MAFAVRETAAFPTGAGGCFPGTAAVGGRHLAGECCIIIIPIRHRLTSCSIDSSHLSKFSLSNTAGNGTITGSLRDAGYSLMIGPREPSTDENNALDLNTQTRYPITLFAPQCGDNSTAECELTLNPFRGFLFRVGPGNNGVDTTEAFELDSELPDHAVAQQAEICQTTQNPPVGGITHVDNSLKSRAGGYITLSADTSITLDVTVVLRACHNESQEVVEACSPANSTYYYSRYYLDAMGEDQPTSSAEWTRAKLWMIAVVASSFVLAFRALC